MDIKESFEPQIIKTQDENGDVHDFELVDIITIDEQDYGLMVYLSEESSKEDEESEEQEVVVMKINKDEEDNYIFEAIENDEEFNKIVSAIEIDEDEEEEEEA